MSATVHPVSDILGAEIRGIDPTGPLDPKDVAIVEQAFLDHLVLRFRDAPLEPKGLAAFARHFGDLQPHVQRKFQHPDVPEVVVMRNVDEGGKFDEAAARRGAMERLRDGWHSDLSYDPVPAKATLLHSVEIPSYGGNTCFANTYAAYEALPEAMKRRLRGLRAEFSYGYNSRNKLTNLAASSLDQQGKDNTTVTHPVVCVHPVTRRPAIYVNPLMTVRIQGLSEADSNALLDELFDWMDRDEFRWEHEWRVGDTLLWENRAGVMHCGRLDYPRNERRIFVRTTVRGQPSEMYEAA